jgi:glycolate oxidase iron-sulfur subunit
MIAPFLDEQKSLACIHCGLCLSSCPTYLETGNENDSPRGRIHLMRAVQSGRLALDAETVRHLDLCLGCRACEVACPSGVQYGDLLEHTRDHVEKHFERSIFQRFLRRTLIEQVFPFPARLKFALLPARVINLLKLRKFLPKFAQDALSLVPQNAQTGALPELSPAIGPRRGTIGFIQGCVMSVMFGPTNLNTVRLLNAAGYDVFTPATQQCCGALYAHSGNLSRAKDCATANIGAFAARDCDFIITNAAGCGSSLKEYGNWIDSQDAKKFGHKIRDISEFLASHFPTGFPASNSIDKTPGSPSDKPTVGKYFDCRVTYHDACHLAHAQRITRAPRDLVRAIARENFIELPEADVCCGSAGTYNLTEPEMAERLQRRKIENILKTKAEIVVTSNPGCILQIQAGLKKAGSNCRVMHLVDYLSEAQTTSAP